MRAGGRGVGCLLKKRGRGGGSHSRTGWVEAHRGPGGGLQGALSWLGIHFSLYKPTEAKLENDTSHPISQQSTIMFQRNSSDLCSRCFCKSMKYRWPQKHYIHKKLCSELFFSPGYNYNYINNCREKYFWLVLLFPMVKTHQLQLHK